MKLNTIEDYFRAVEEVINDSTIEIQSDKKLSVDSKQANEWFKEHKKIQKRTDKFSSAKNDLKELFMLSVAYETSKRLWLLSKLNSKNLRTIKSDILKNEEKRKITLSQNAQNKLIDAKYGKNTIFMKNEPQGEITQNTSILEIPDSNDKLKKEYFSELKRYNHNDDMVVSVENAGRGIGQAFPQYDYLGINDYSEIYDDIVIKSNRAEELLKLLTSMKGIEFKPLATVGPHSEAFIKKVNNSHNNRMHYQINRLIKELKQYIEKCDIVANFISDYRHCKYNIRILNDVLSFKFRETRGYKFLEEYKKVYDEETKKIANIITTMKYPKSDVMKQQYRGLISEITESPISGIEKILAETPFQFKDQEREIRKKNDHAKDLAQRYGQPPKLIALTTEDQRKKIMVELIGNLADLSPTYEEYVKLRTKRDITFDEFVISNPNIPRDKKGQYIRAEHLTDMGTPRYIVDYPYEQESKRAL